MNRVHLKNEKYLFPFAKICWFFMVLTLCINMFAMDVYIPAMTLMVKDLNTSTYSLKLIFIINFIEFSLSALLFGAFADIKGRKPSIVLALSCALVGQLFSVFSTNFISLFLARCIQYLGAGALSSMFITLICDTYEGQKRAKAIALFELALPLSIVFGPAIGAKLLSFVGWKGTFGFFTVIQLICFLGVVFTLRETLQSKKVVAVQDAIKGAIDLIKDPIAATLILILGLAEGGFMIYTILSPFFYIQIFNLSIVSYAKYQTVAVVFFLSGLFSYRYILNIATPLKIFNISLILYFCFGIGLVCFYENFITSTPMTLCILIIIMHFICGLISPSGNTVALQRVNARLIGTGAATIASTNNLIVGIAMLCGTYMIKGESLMNFYGCLFFIVILCVLLWSTFLKLSAPVTKNSPATN